MNKQTRFALRAHGVLFLATLLSVAGCSQKQGDSESGMQRVTIGTLPSGTLYNQIGVAVASVLQREVGVASTARPYTGASNYLPPMHRGEIALGINNAADTQAAYEGEANYSERMRNLRIAMLVARAPYQYFSKADSGIRTVGDLRGKPTITTFRANTSLTRVNRAVLATAGLTPEDVQQVAVAGTHEAIRSLLDDRVVAASAILGIPSVREADVATPGGLRALALGPNEAALASLPGLNAVTLEPGPEYVAVREPTRVVLMDVYLNTGVHVPADDVYLMVKTLHERWADLQEMLPMLKRLSATELAPASFGHPYHEGAMRYFKEAGLWTAAHDTAQQALLD